MIGLATNHQLILNQLRSRIILRSQCNSEPENNWYIKLRVRSWRRMSAGGVPNSGKSNGVCRTEVCGWKIFKLSGGRVSNAWVTCLVQGDSSWKRLVKPHKRTTSHEGV